MQITYSRRQLLFMVIGSAATAVPLVFPALGFLQWIAMIPLFIGLYRLGESAVAGLWRMYRYGFLTVFAYYFVIYHWFVNLYPLDFAGLDHTASVVVVLAGWLGLSLLQAIPGGLMFLLYGLLCRTGIFKRVPLLRPFAFAALWIVFEWSSTLGWTGVPWGRLCLGQIQYLPMLQSASLFGSYFISLLILLVNGLLAYAVLYQMRATVCGVTAAALVSANLCFGLIRFHLPEEDLENTVRVAVVQGNISSHDKWDENGTQKTMDVHAELTRQAATEGAEIVLWAETVFPFVFNYRTDLQEFASELARECNVTLILGAIYADSDEKEYNALYEITPSGEISTEVYAKRHLVPFGEYVPMRGVFEALIPPLAELSALDDDLTPGTETALIDVNGMRLGALICFDSIYEELNRSSVMDGAELMLLSTNDSWFRDSAALRMHCAQAQLRAIEGNRFVLRAANTGISAIISNKGVTEIKLAPLTEGIAVRDVAVKSQTSLYMWIGNCVVYLCIAFYAVLLLAGVLTRKAKPSPVKMASHYGRGF